MSATNGSLTFRWQDDDLDDDDDIQIHGNTRLYILILFAIILLITIIFFIYSRRARTSSGNSSVHRNSPTSSCSIRQGLNADAINSLPITIYRQSEMNHETTSECAVCLGVFEVGEKVKMMPVCCHCYHCECIDKWLLTQSSCPVCRTSVRVDSPV